MIERRSKIDVGILQKLIKIEFGQNISLDNFENEIPGIGFR